MCRIKDARTVMVCDVAIGRVRTDLAATISDQDRIRYTISDGQGTLVEADPNVDAQQFLATTQAAIAAAQAGDRPPVSPQPGRTDTRADAPEPPTS